jgi:hypothetical protein
VTARFVQIPKLIVRAWFRHPLLRTFSSLAWMSATKSRRRRSICPGVGEVADRELVSQSANAHVEVVPLIAEP